MTNLQHSTPELLARMQQALATRDIDGAQRMAEIVLVREPAQEDVVGFLVGLALARGDHFRALNVARGAVRARPDSARLQIQHGLALAAAGHHEAALQAFRLAREHDPTMPAAALCQADCERALGRDDAALCSQFQALGLAERKGMLAQIDTLPPPLRDRIQRAINDIHRARRAAIEPALAPLRASVGTAAIARIDRALTRL